MKAIINNKEYNVKVIDDNYNETSVEVKILDGTFAGKCAIVRVENLISNTEDLALVIENLETLIEETFEDENLNITSDGDYVFINTGKYQINILVSYENEKIEYYIDTENINKKSYDIYENKYKNAKTVKTLKGVIGYVKRFI